MVQVYLKVVRVKGEVLVAICDRELLGKKFEDRDRNLVLEVKESFYKGELVDSRFSLDQLKGATIVNMVGRGIIREVVESGVIRKESVISVGGVPHAQIIKMK